MQVGRAAALADPDRPARRAGRGGRRRAVIARRRGQAGREAEPDLGEVRAVQRGVVGGAAGREHHVARSALGTISAATAAIAPACSASSRRAKPAGCSAMSAAIPAPGLLPWGCSVTLEASHFRAALRNRALVNKRCPAPLDRGAGHRGDSGSVQDGGQCGRSGVLAGHALQLAASAAALAVSSCPRSLTSRTNTASTGTTTAANGIGPQEDAARGRVAMPW